MSDPLGMVALDGTLGGTPVILGSPTLSVSYDELAQLRSPIVLRLDARRGRPIRRHEQRRPVSSTGQAREAHRISAGRHVVGVAMR